jgi:hypothetical protein
MNLEGKNNGGKHRFRWMKPYVDKIWLDYPIHEAEKENNFNNFLATYFQPY